MTVKLTKEARLKIAILYLDGVPTRSLRERFNVNASTITKVLRAAGIETPKSGMVKVENARSPAKLSE